MKKLALLCAMALVLAALSVPQVYAVDITIPDTQVGAGDPWWINPLETNETEPGTLTGKVWDLQTFQQTGASITMTGGYNFKDGYGGFAPGDLFIAANTAKPLFGSGAPGSNPTLKNVYGYNYVVVPDSSAYATYSVYAIDADTAVQLTTYFRFSDPWLATVASGNKVGGGTLLYTSNPGTGGNDFTLDYVGLLNQIPGYDAASYAYLHYTYQCGNDFMMGSAQGFQVPLPPSALLLGSGLLGLVGLGWRRRKTNV
jgi:hypothetical protein